MGGAMTMARLMTGYGKKLFSDLILTNLILFVSQVSINLISFMIYNIKELDILDCVDQTLSIWWEIEFISNIFF